MRNGRKGSACEKALGGSPAEATIVSRCEALRADAPNWRPTGSWGAMNALASPAQAKTHSEGTFMLGVAMGDIESTTAVALK